MVRGAREVPVWPKEAGMFGKRYGRIAAHTAAALAAGAAVVAVAAPAQAQQVAIRPHQNFTGLVIGKTKLSQIDVQCAGPETMGHPAAGQSVEVKLMVPGSTGGYTGNHGTSITANLTWPTPPVATLRIATFTHYSVMMPISTKIKVPCNGSGVMSFDPAPNPDKSAIPATVDVTFFSNGV
jgi:hypothetical protein